jgi:hypothetical protein
VLLFVSFQNICPGLGLFVIFCNTCLFSEEWLVPHPTIKLENHPLLPVHNCWINTFSATLHIWRPSPQSTTCICAMLWWQWPTCDHSVCKMAAGCWWITLTCVPLLYWIVWMPCWNLVALLPLERGVSLLMASLWLSAPTQALGSF